MSQLDSCANADLLFPKIMKSSMLSCFRTRESIANRPKRVLAPGQRLIRAAAVFAMPIMCGPEAIYVGKCRAFDRKGP